MMDIILRSPGQSDLRLTGDDAALKAGMYREIAQRCGGSIWDVFQMVKLTLFGPAALKDKWYPERDQDCLQRDRDDMERWGPILTIDQLIEIWRRAHAAIQNDIWRERDPDRIAKLKDFLAERDAVMSPFIAKWKRWRRGR